MRSLRLGIAFAMLFACVGCTAQRVLYRPTEADRTLLDEPPLDLSVAVVPWAPNTHRGQNAAAYAKPLVSLLESTHAFRSVVYDPSGTANTDLIAESTGDYCNSAIIPLFTIITVGIVPTIWDEGDCSGVVLRRRDVATAGAKPVVARIHYTGRAVMGLAAVPLGLFPGWTWSMGASQSSYQQAFKVAIFQRREELTAPR